jgi:hypothetical protein
MNAGIGSNIAFPSSEFSSGNGVFKFPSGFSPFDVATVSLSDSTGAVVSTATLTPISSGFYTAVSPATSGSAAPSAAGYVAIHARKPIFLPMVAASQAVSSNLVIFALNSGSLSIHAHGLPVSTKVTYLADGTVLGTAETDSAGNLSLYAAQKYHGKLPSSLDLFTVKSVTVEDGSGNVYLTAGF